MSIAAIMPGSQSWFSAEFLCNVANQTDPIRTPSVPLASEKSAWRASSPKTRASENREPIPSDRSGYGRGRPCGVACPHRRLKAVSRTTGAARTDGDAGRRLKSGSRLRFAPGSASRAPATGGSFRRPRHSSQGHRRSAVHSRLRRGKRGAMNLRTLRARLARQHRRGVGGARRQGICARPRRKDG